MSSSTPTLARPLPLARRSWAAPEARQILVRVGTFAALSLFGVLRWGTLLQPAPTGRLLGLVAVAVALALIGPPLAARSRTAAGLAAVLAALAMLAISGLPLPWIRHVRIAVSARAVNDGLSALPRLLVPYKGVNPWVRMVTTMGAGLLLLDAALMMAFAMPASRPGRPGGGPRRSEPGRPRGGDLRRAVAALPLVALVTVPLTLVPAQLPYLQGALLFALLAAMVWGERLPEASRPTASLACLIAVTLAWILAPALSSHTPWINYQTLASGISVGNAESFDWNQHYGPLNWPRQGREVLEVRAPRGDYWKAENLDVFGGGGWTTGTTPEQPAGGISAAALRRWTQTLTVTIAAMKTSDVIGAGEMAQPLHATQAMEPGLSPGTWTAANPLTTGDSYTVSTYAPHPSAAALARAGTGYPSQVIPAELRVTLPAVAGANNRAPVVWADQFGSPPPALVESDVGNYGVALLQASPYAGVYRLAQRLRAGSATPYGYVERVMHYLAHGFRYDENPPPSRYPLVSFLLSAHRGYCQQFAGSMALLLRLGGVPARVVAGFTAGQYDPAARRWLVSDYDAHAWVEVFFPSYGWVRFDPTPAVDPALQHSTLGSLLSAGDSQQSPERKHVGSHGLGTTTTPAASRGSHHGHTGASLLWPVLAGLALLVLAGLVLLTRPLAHPGPDELVDELERAFARSGRPLTPEVTLAELERRLAATPGASDYVRRLREARYAGAAGTPSSAGRRALRAHLRAGLGMAGALRALWALPPRRAPRSGQDTGLH